MIFTAAQAKPKSRADKEGLTEGFLALFFGDNWGN